MSENGNVPEMEIMLAQMVKLYEQKIAEVDRLAAELKVARIAAGRIHAMLRLGGVIEKKEAPKKTKPRGANETTVNNIVKAIHTIEDGSVRVLDDVPFSFTASMISAATGHSGSVVRRALEDLREQGLIRLAGSHRGGSGRAAQVYALVQQ